MQAPKYSAGSRVRIKGSSRSFTVQIVYTLLECPNRPSGHYYSGEFICDIHEDRLEPVSSEVENAGCELPTRNSNKTKFSKNLRTLIKKGGVTFTELSVGSRVPRSSCYDAAYRGAPQKVSTLINLAKFFNVSMDDLMFGDIVDEGVSGESTKQ